MKTLLFALCCALMLSSALFHSEKIETISYTITVEEASAVRNLTWDPGEFWKFLKILGANVPETTPYVFGGHFKGNFWKPRDSHIPPTAFA